MSRKSAVISLLSAIFPATVLPASADAVVPPLVDIEPESGSFGWLILLLLLLLGIIVCAVIYLHERKNRNKKKGE